MRKSIGICSIIYILIPAILLFSGQGLCWQTSGVTWSENSTTMSLNLGDEWNPSAEDALYRWNNVPGSSFVYDYDNTNHNRCDRGTLCMGTDGNAVEWEDFSNGICSDPASDALAITRLNWAIHYCNADVLFNSAYSWTTQLREYTTGSPYNLNSVAIHEFGHALGLEHEDRWLATMNSIYHANAHKIHADDKGGLRHAYGSGGTHIDIAPTNWKKQNTSSSVPADLVDSPTTANTGDTISMEWTQENHGTVDVTFDIDFYISSNPYISTSDRRLGTNYGASQNSESSSTFSRTLTIPTNLPEGTYWLGVILDSNNQLAEYDEHNNALAHPRSIFIRDTIKPTPDPMTWSTPPDQVDSHAITMRATRASDATTPVEYYFRYVGSFTGGTGGNDSGWITSNTYTDTGLEPNHMYGYSVRARDSASEPNYTEYSSYIYVYTDIEKPVGIAFGTITTSSIAVRSTNTPSGLDRGRSGLLLECMSNGNSGWKKDNNFWIKTGLNPNTLYSFRAKARNGDGDETDYSGWHSRYTGARAPGAPVLSNITPSTIDVAVDPNGNPSYTDYTIGYYENSVFYYVQADGGRGSTPVWQTASEWGTVTVNGLLSGTRYCFYARARNGNNLLSGWSSPGCADTAVRTITVISPNGGEKWYIGSSRIIRWRSQFAGDSVKIVLSRDRGNSWSTIVDTTSNDGSYVWTVPGPESAKCRIRITSITYPDVIDDSDADFTIMEEPPPCYGDVNSDGRVDEDDLATFAGEFGRSDCGSELAGMCQCDFKTMENPPDGDVDGYDLAVLAAEFGRSDCP